MERVSPYNLVILIIKSGKIMPLYPRSPSMRFVFILLSVISASVLACGNPGAMCGTSPASCSASPAGGCGCNCGTGGGMMLETLTYAINELGLSDNGDIRTAIRLYKKEMRTFKPKIPMEAFEGGEFHPDIYAKNAAPARALQAQSDLFETIYLVLNDEQKKEFPVLMGMYQHHMEFITLPRKLCGTAAGRCGAPAMMCDTPPYQGCGAKNCKSPMKISKTPPKR